jgi:hypothetical protein
MPKSVAEKLLIKPQSTIWLSAREHRGLVEPLPAGATHVTGPGRASVAVVFAADAAAARSILDQNRVALAAPDVFWVAYPKGNRTDINRDSLWPILSEYGMRPISQVAIDEVWSALRFRMLKQGEAPFTGGKA